MEKFIIQGGVPLSGEIVPAGNKNAALPILAACLLTEEELLVRNVPRIRDVESMLGLLERLGASVAWTGENEVRLHAAQISGTEVDEELANRIRASFLVAGPLLARCGEVRMPPPGGDTIGRRRLDAHLDAFRDLGAKIDGDVWIELSAPPDGLKPKRIFMDEPSVMGTENALLAAALTEGPTTIANAASEPHVQDLARLLCKMGAEVDAIPKIADGPWPAFPADLTSIALALATQADGTIMIHEKMFENRLFFVDKLVAMGARIPLSDPHRAVVSGPSRLHGARLESPDIRAGMAMLIAALAADGTSEIGNVAQIDRGYERIDMRLRDLGAPIERVASDAVPA